MVCRPEDDKCDCPACRRRRGEPLSAEDNAAADLFEMMMKLKKKMEWEAAEDSEYVHIVETYDEVHVEGEDLQVPYLAILVPSSGVSPMLDRHGKKCMMIKMTPEDYRFLLHAMAESLPKFQAVWDKFLEENPIIAEVYSAAIERKMADQN